jgi:Peptidase A4 family
MDRRLPSRLARSLGACAPVLGLLIVTGAGNASAAPVPVNARAAALATLKHVVVGEHGTSHAPGGQAVQGSFGPKKVTSGDWSGYADNGRSYTTVTARWKEPSVTCGPDESMAAFWVGIDGYGSATVEQAGSLAYCYQGKPFYYTWWEMYPHNAIQIVGDSAQAGDQIDASVTTSAIKNGTKYILRVTDTTTPGNTFTKYRDCSSKKCDSYSAECVVEAPADPGSGQYPLAHFTPWTAEGATVKTAGQSGTISTFPDFFITMKSSAPPVVLAEPGPLNHAGDSFTDTWLASG